MTKIECPYCNHEYEIENYSYDGDTNIETCSLCEKEFKAVFLITTEFITTRIKNDS